ncbi:hypothetical protein ABIE28_000812 [Devosia sp. 2618]
MKVEDMSNELIPQSATLPLAGFDRSRRANRSSGAI